MPVPDEFNPGAHGYRVLCTVVQPDGKILVGGTFTNLGGQRRISLARVYADGTLDDGFRLDAGLSFGDTPDVYSLAIQTDGKILVGGHFDRLGGQIRSGIARLNADGTLDSTFDLPSTPLYSLAVQADGRILVGGAFTNIAGQGRDRIARLNNTEPAMQSLSYDGLSMTWLRGGAGPEVWRTSFEVATNGMDWVSLGEGSRVLGGWQLPDVLLPTNALVRVLGYVIGGYQNGSAWFVENWWPAVPPQIWFHNGSLGLQSNVFGFNLGGSAGSVVVVESSSNLVGWVPFATNLLGTGPAYISDPSSAGSPARFYRARLAP